MLLLNVRLFDASTVAAVANPAWRVDMRTYFSIDLMYTSGSIQVSIRCCRRRLFVIVFCRHSASILTTRAYWSTRPIVVITMRLACSVISPHHRHIDL